MPLAVRPGTILETGDTFSFSAHLAPTLPGKVDVTVTGPDEFSRTISGRANAIGYFYDPDQDFEIKVRGVYHVSVIRNRHLRHAHFSGAYGPALSHGHSAGSGW